VRSFWFHKGSTAYALEGNLYSNNVFGPLREWEDCAVVSTTATRLAERFDDGATAHTLRFRRLLYLQQAPWNAQSGPLGAITTAYLAQVDLDGAFLSTGSAGTKDFEANPGGRVQNVCYESLNSSATDFQGYVSSTTLSVPTLSPDAADGRAVGTLVGDPQGPDLCERAKPVALGIAEVGTAHVLLGDFAMQQLYPAYTSRPGLLEVRREASPWACGIGPELVPLLGALAVVGWRRRYASPAKPRARGGAGRTRG